jgi:dCMP deaminase
MKSVITTQNKPSWDNSFIDICKVISKRSTCLKIKTSSIIVKNNNIISIGYNGVPSKMEHCTDYWFNIWNSDWKQIMSFEDFLQVEYFREQHHNWSYFRELHAEMNAILQSKTDISGSTLYTLLSPCINCSKCIITSGIKKVVFVEKYNRDYDMSKLLLENNGIVLEQVLE